MTSVRAPLRLVAALLASAGMLALPLRTLAACPMLAQGKLAAVTHHESFAGGEDEHAGHEMTDTRDEVPERPTSPDAPAHESCPDFAHCAVALVPTSLALAVDPTSPLVALRDAAQSAPLSAVRALEPPPPKA